MPYALHFDVGQCLTDVSTEEVACFFGGPLDGLQFYMKRAPRYFVVFHLGELMTGYRVFASYDTRVDWGGVPYPNPIGCYEHRTTKAQRHATSTTSSWSWVQNPDYKNRDNPALDNPKHIEVCVEHTIQGSEKFFIDARHSVAGIRNLAAEAKRLAKEDELPQALLSQLHVELDMLEHARTIVQNQEWGSLGVGFLSVVSRIADQSASHEHRLQASMIMRALYTRNKLALLDLPEMTLVLDDIEAKIRKERWVELSSEDEAKVRTIWNCTGAFLGHAQELRARCERILEALEDHDPDVLDEKEGAGDEWKS